MNIFGAIWIGIGLISGLAYVGYIITTEKHDNVILNCIYICVAVLASLLGPLVTLFVFEQIEEIGF